MVLRVEKKLFVIEQPIPPAFAADSAANVLAEWNVVYDAHNEVACLVLGRGGKTIGPYVIRMKNYEEKLERLAYAVTPQVLVIQGDRIQKANKKSLNAKGKVLVIQGDRIQKANKKSLNAKGKGKGKGNGKDKSYIHKPKNPKPSAKEHPTKNDACHHCKEVGHWKRNCPVYLAELMKNKNGRAIDFREIQDEDTSPSKNTSEIPMEVEGFEPPQEEVIPVRRSVWTHRAPERLCLNVKADEHSLRDLNEPANYKAVMLDPESNKWLDVMNVEMQSMKDNQVRRLVDLPPDCFDDASHPRKICKLQRPIYGLKRASKSWNKRFDEEIKRFGFAQNLDELCLYQKASGSNVTFLILYVDDIIIMENHIPSFQSVKTYLGKCFTMKDLEEAAFILGIKMYQDKSKRLIGLS
nr:putative retrotransposon protein [Tanacetum cinerariifolium]